MKRFVINARIIKIVDPSDDFMVCIVACKERIGGSLMKNGNLVCYESRKLKEHKKNYVTHYLELNVIVCPLKMWIHYSMGRKFD